MPIDDYRPLPDFPDVYDRARAAPRRDRVYIRESKFAQGSEVNEALSIEERKRTNVGNLIARDGDRVKGADIIVDIGADTVTLAAGQIYLRGDVRDVPEAILEDMAMTGDVVVGVRVLSTITTFEEDPTLFGLHEGTASFGEDGAIRETLSLSWGWAGDGEEGDLYRVYQLRDGGVVDQTPPPSLSGVNQAIAIYDYDAHENYIARGCSVTPLGLAGGKQWFSIEEGTANILGFKRTRNTATRYGQTEEPDILNIASEPHTFDDDGTGTAVIALNRTPINSVMTAIVTKEVTETIVRGGAANTMDLLGHASVTSIVEVKQGGTTYASPASYLRNGDRIDWSPGGAEPAGASSYTVKYRYLDVVVPSAVNQTSVTVAGGVTGGSAFVTYSYRLPRHDRICLDSNGLVVYLKGISTVEQPQPPASPATLLSLCVVQNDWFGTPVVINNGVRAYPFWLIDRMYNRLVDELDLIALSRLQLDISSREPVAKKGVFVDPFNDDRYRDAGAGQNGAVFNGSFQMPIIPAFQEFSLAGPQYLNFTEEVFVAQEAVTGCTRINPYQSFAPLPAKMSLVPSQDFWTDTQDVSLSPVTQVFGQGNASRVTNVEIITSTREITARFLRQINVAFTIDGFGVGETLAHLTFDTIDVTPAGPLVGDANGRITGTFTIPANVASGTKHVGAIGGGASTANTEFSGQGQVEINTNQQVTTVQRFQQPPPRSTSGLTGGGANGGSRSDPVAQSFQFVEGRHISSQILRHRRPQPGGALRAGVDGQWLSDHRRDCPDRDRYASGACRRLAQIPLRSTGLRGSRAGDGFRAEDERCQPFGVVRGTRRLRRRATGTYRRPALYGRCAVLVVQCVDLDRASGRGSDLSHQCGEVLACHQGHPARHGGGQQPVGLHRPGAGIPADRRDAAAVRDRADRRGGRAHRARPGLGAAELLHRQCRAASYPDRH